MEISIGAKPLKDAIDRALRFVPSSRTATSPFMSTVLFEFKMGIDGTPLLILSAVDSHKAFQVAIDLFTWNEGLTLEGYRFCLHPKGLSTVLGSAKGSVTLNLEGAPLSGSADDGTADGPVDDDAGSLWKLKVKTKASEFSFDVLGGSSFKDYYERLADAVFNAEKMAFDIESGTLSDAVDQSGYAVSGDRAKIVLNSLQLVLGGSTDQDASNMTVVAADGHRAAICSFSSATSGIEGEKEIHIPFDLIGDALASVSGSRDDVIRFEISEKVGSVSSDATGRLALFRVTAGQYPDVRRVMPASFAGKYTVNGSDLHEAISLLRQVSEESLVKVRFDEEAGSIKLSMGWNSINSGEHELTAHFQVGGEVPVEMAFNAGYLLDAAKAAARHASKGLVTMAVNSVSSPVLLMPQECTHSLITSDRHMLMPVVIRNN